jgi:hypothetical protein
MKKKIPLITCALIAAFLFVFFKPNTLSLGLPEDLLFQGRPIHPSTIVAALFGDSSRFEPHPIGDNERINLKIKLDAKTIQLQLTYTYPSG